MTIYSSPAAFDPQWLAIVAAQQQAIGFSGLGNPFGGLPPAPKPAPIEDAGITVGEIVAHRIWRLNHAGFAASMSAHWVWAPDDVIEGDPEAGLGVHAWKTASGALTYAGEYRESLIIGRIAMWGCVIEHEIGYRSQYARIVQFDRLILHQEWGPRWRSIRRLRRLRELYGLEAA